MSSQSPTPLQIAPRQPGDLAGTIRFTDLSGGSFKRKAQAFYRQELEPMAFDSQNIDQWSRPGQWFLCPKINTISTDGADHEYQMVTFNGRVYKLPRVTGVAADIQSTNDPSGAANWDALANAYGGTLPLKNGIVWKNQLVIASGEVGANALRVLSAAEVWSVIAAAAPAPTTAAALQVGIGPDDRLLVWFDQQGLYAYDGAAWLKVWPTTAATGPVEGTCDMIARGIGSTIFAVRDAQDIGNLYEYSIESTGVLFIAHFADGIDGLRFWSDSLDVYNGACWIGGRLGARSNRGIMFRKEKLAAPEPMFVLDTNLQGGLANDGRGLDWSIRCVKAMGDMIWVGASSQQDHSMALFRVSEDENGMIVHPASCRPDLQGPIYSIATLPQAVLGANERLFLSGPSRTFYKDREDGADPTADADDGWVQLPDVDYGAEDRSKKGRFVEGVLLEKGTGATDEFQYRVDPPTPSSPWTTLGQFNTVSSATTPPDRLSLGHDNEAGGVYGKNFRRFQPRIHMTRATSGVARSRIDTLAIDVVEIRPPGL